MLKIMKCVIIQRVKMLVGVSNITRILRNAWKCQFGMRDRQSGIYASSSGCNINSSAAGNVYTVWVLEVVSANMHNVWIHPMYDSQSQFTKSPRTTGTRLRKVWIQLSTSRLHSSWSYGNCWTESWHPRFHQSAPRWAPNVIVAIYVAKSS